MGELLRPPSHRGPLIAAGAVTLSVGGATFLARYEPAAGITLAVAGALTLVFGWLAIQGGHPGGPPLAFASVLIVVALGWFAAALTSLADLLSDEDPGARSVTLIALVLAAAAAWASRRRSSAIAALIVALSAGTALIAAWEWVFEPGAITPFRWLLLLLALVYGLVSLPMRGTSQRHAEQMVNAAGVAILAIPLSGGALFLFGRPYLPGFFEGVVVVAGLGLVAYAAADRAPGAAYLGVANLALFILTPSVALVLIPISILPVIHRIISHFYHTHIVNELIS